MKKTMQLDYSAKILLHKAQIAKNFTDFPNSLNLIQQMNCT